METVMAKVRQEEELIELAKKAAEEVLDVELSDTTPQTPLRSLGMDSLDQLEFAAVLEDALDVRIPDSRLKELETVGDLIATLMELQAARPGGDGVLAADAVAGERLTDVSR
jgi:acyl carrier protein